MCDKAACDRQSKCSYLLKKLQNFFHHDKIVDGGDSIKQLTQIISVVSGCDEGQAYFKAIQQCVVQAMIGLLEGSGDHFILLPPEGDLFDELNALHVLSLLAFQTEDIACLEEIASCPQGYPSDGYLMISVGVMLIQRMKYRPSEKCFLSALSYFEHKQNHLGAVVATVNLAVFHKICGDYRKAQFYCNAAVRLCLDFTRTPAADVHLKVVFRLAILSQELTDYNSYHDILRVAVKFDIDQISDAFVVKYMKQLMTLQLKEHEGEHIKHDELEEFALQLIGADAFPKTQPLNADFIVTFMMLADMYCSIKCFKEARQLIHKLESTFLHVYGGNCPLFGFLQYKISHFKYIYGEVSEAQNSLIKAEQIFINYFGREHHMVGSCKSLKGACALQRGNQKEACRYLKEARIIFEKINLHHPKIGTILLKFADLESEAGNFENAKLAIEEALEMFMSSCGKVSLQTAFANLEGASILQRKGKFMHSALDKVKKTTHIFILHGLCHDHPDVAFCHCLQGQLLHSLGQVKEAEEEFLFVHHQLSSWDDLSLKTKVITHELYRMFFLVDDGGLVLKGSLCSHFLSLVSLACMKTGDEKMVHMREMFSCLEELDSRFLTVSDHLGKHVHCALQIILEAYIQVYCILIPDSATSLEEESFSSSCSGKEKRPSGDYEDVYLMSSCRDNGKRPHFLLFWKTSDVLETGDLGCVTSSFRDSVKLLCLQPKFRKTFHEKEEFFMKLPIQEQSSAVPSLSSQIDSLPLLVDFELSKLHIQCDGIVSPPTASTLWPFAHVSYISYRFSSSDKALLVFYKWVSSLGRTLELSEVHSFSTPKGPSALQRNCAVHFTFLDPICASLSLAVEEGSVYVKCRAVKESGSTCICSSVKSALESIMESLESDFQGSVFEQTLCLPCVDGGGENCEEPTKCFCHRKDFQEESCNSDQKLDLHAQTNWEPDSDLLKIGRSVDLSQTEDTESLSFTAHSGDKIGTDVCVNLLECILRNRQLSLEIQLSGNNDGLYTTDGTEEHVNSLLTPVSASSLNSLPLSQYDATHENPEFMQKALPSLKNVCGETYSGKETGNVSNTSSTSQGIFVSSHYHESAAVKSNCEEGWIAKYHPSSETKDNLPPNGSPQETCSVQSIEACSNKEELREDHGMEFDQSLGLPLITENGKGTIPNGNLICELQDEVVFYQDQCYELREELVKLKEKLKLCEEEKLGLQADVGRQLFLENKERRCREKVYQPPSKHASGMSKPVGVRGASHDFSGTDARLLGGAGPLEKAAILLQQRLREISLALSESELSRIKKLVRPMLDSFRLARIREGSELFEELERRGKFSFSFVKDLLERIHRFDLVEKLAEPFHNGGELCRRESCSPQESKQLVDMSESVSGVNGKQCDEMEERKEIFDNTEVDEEDEVCNNSNVNSLNGDKEGAALTFHAENLNGSRFFGDVDLSEERYDSASGLSQSFDVSSIGLDSREKSWSPSFTVGQFESEKLKGACAANGKWVKEVTHDFSFPDGAETQSYSNHHFNDTIDGAANLPDRAQDSLKQEDLTSVNQDSLPNGDTNQRQNVSGARFTAQKDTATDLSDSHVSSQSKKWEHLGARPRDRPLKTDRCPEPSLLNSLEDLVPPQVAEPVAHGVANTFLERHSEDKHLHESLYYTNVEKMLTENSSLQGASHVDSMVNLTESNKAQLYFGECQVPFRPDPYSQTYVSLFPQTSGACIGGNNSSNTGFNLLNPNVANNFVPFTGLQDGTFPSLQRNEVFHSGFTGSGLTSDFMQPTGSQIGAFNALNSNSSLNEYALGTRQPQIRPDGHFTSLQINQPIHLGLHGSGFTSDLIGSTRPEMTHSATGTHRNSDFRGSASILPSTRNSGLLGSSSVNKQTYGFPPDASPTSSSGARVNGSDSRLFSESESSRVSQLLPVTTGSDGLNTSEEVNSSSNAMNASGDHLASGHYREGSRAYNSSSSHMISGTDTGESQSGKTEDSVTNRNYGTETVESTDNSLLELEQRVEEACAMVERVLREREEREEFGREIERKEHEIQAERARKKREREARELEEARGWPQQQEPVTGTHRNSDFRGSASMLPSTRNSELLNPSVANNFVPFTRLQGGTFPSLQIDEVFRSGYTGSVLTSDLMTTGLQTSVMSGADQHFGQLGGSMMNTNSVTELVNSPNNTLHELEQGADEGCALVEIVSREREEREQFGQEIERPECEIGAERAQQRERDERELRVAIREQQCQEAMRRPSLCQEEREIGAEGVQQTTVCVVRSLNANNNSCQALAEDIEAATARIQARWPWFGRWWSWFGRWWSWFGRWWCTCAGGLRDHDFGVICSNCFKYKYCGPCRVKPQSDQNECCICLEDVSSGCMILPCSHKVHRECAIAMIQNGIRMCPVCRYPLYSPAPE